jgi:hypothetical protein
VLCRMLLFRVAAELCKPTIKTFDVKVYVPRWASLLACVYTLISFLFNAAGRCKSVGGIDTFRLKAASASGTQCVRNKFDF